MFEVESSVNNLFTYNKQHKLKLLIDPNRYYFDYKLAEDRKKFNKIVLITGLEPIEIYNNSDVIINKQKYFDDIFCSSPNILNNCKNSTLFPFGSCWVLTDENGIRVDFKKDYYNIFNLDKDFELSFVMSNKNYLPGHKLRHASKDIIKIKRDFKLMFPDSISIENKNLLFRNSMFHICIENSQHPNYFSEKIIDCFMTYTVPIYWGCPNLHDFFDTKGVMFFQTSDQLIDILNNLTPEEYYKRIDSIKINYNISYQKYAFFYDRINEIINK